MREVSRLVGEIESRTINHKMNKIHNHISSDVAYTVIDEVGGLLEDRISQIRLQIKNEIEKVIA